MNQPIPGPLESLIVKDNPYQLAQFIHGASVLRAVTANGYGEDTVTVAPLRGSMPIIWCSQGLPEEGGTISNLVEVPLGEFSYVDRRNGLEVQRTTSPTAQQKDEILKRTLYGVVEDMGVKASDLSLALIDEVQKGGTIAVATQLLANLALKGGFNPQISLAAVQDIRKKVAEQPKTKGYRDISSNSQKGVTATVVPVPLITTDRPSMLDKIALKDGVKYNRNIRMYDALQVHRNHVAEELFRTLGTLYRHYDMRADTGYFIERVLGTQVDPLNEKASNRAEWWLTKLLERLNAIDLEAR